MRNYKMFKNQLINIPEVKGEIRKEYKLSQINWFKVGGDAEVLFLPKDLKDLRIFLSKLSENIPLTIIGAGSNTLIRDGGLGGVVVKLGKSFSALKILNDYRIQVGASYNCIKLSRILANKNLSGLEFFSGIPGTVGGAVSMNAGAFGSETSDFLVGIKVLDRKGNIKSYKRTELKMSYRFSMIPKSNIILEAIFNCKKDKSQNILKTIETFQKKRSNSQPIKNATGGSTFKNPDNAKAWKLIKDSGCEDMFEGGATLSKMHSNFIINSGNCSSADIEKLGEKIRKKVKAVKGINLEWEIKIIGSKKKYKRYFDG